MKRLLILLLALPLVLLAHEYSLDELIEQGMQNGWDAQRSQLQLESSASQLSSATWNLIPDADLSYGLNYDLHNKGTGADLTNSFRFSISKTISLNDAAWFNYKQAKIGKDKAELTYKSSISAYAFSVFEAYLKVLSAQKQLVSLQENLAIQTRVWQQAQVLRQLGKNTEFDVKQSEIAVMNSNISIMQLENTIRSNREQLFGLVQVEDEGYPLTDLEAARDYQIPELDPDGINQIRILKEEIRSTNLSQKQSSLGFWPHLSLNYSLVRNAGGDNFSFDRYSTNHGVSLNLSYSLWNYFRQGSSHKRSNISLRMAELSLLDKVDEIRRQYQNASQELEYLIRLDELYQEKLDQSSRQINIAEERYRLGLIDLLELDKTRTDYIDADIAYNANRYQILAKQESLNFLLSHKILGKW
ncbi:MAG: TolC family protein [Candidatus Cloacimonadaceae bacterium]